MSYSHASIIPLIGGMTIAQHQESNTIPEYFMTYTGFQDNESHLLNYYNQRYDIEIPYHFIDKNDFPTKKIDIVNTTCPCAGLSQLSSAHGTHNPNNQWMIKSAQYILGQLKPKVFWGENAPGFATNIGKDIREQLYKIGLDNGYTMSVYSTRSIIHGTPQIRPRSFYFFWKDNKVPLLNYYKREHIKIEDLIRSVKSNTMNEPINKKKPSDDPWYKFILEEIYGGINHKTFSHEKMVEMKSRSNDVFSFIEKTHNYNQVGEWLKKNGYQKEYEKCKYKFDKIEAGKNIMRRGTIIPKDNIGAFVSHYPTSLTHPDEDRYITYREAMSIMGLPEDFELLKPKRSVNHICQNVPVKTAFDMATEVHKYLNDELEMIDASFIHQNNINKTHVTNNQKIKTLVDFF